MKKILSFLLLTVISFGIKTAISAEPSDAKISPPFISEEYLRIKKSEARFGFTVPFVHITSTAKSASGHCGVFTAYNGYSIPLYLAISGRFSSHGFNTFVFSEIKKQKTGSIVNTAHYMRLENLRKAVIGCILSVKKDVFTDNEKNMADLAFIGKKLGVDYLIIPCYVEFVTHCLKGKFYFMVLSCWNVKTGELLFSLFDGESVTDRFMDYSAQNIYYNIFYDKYPPQYERIIDKIVYKLNEFKNG